MLCSVLSALLVLSAQRFEESVGFVRDFIEVGGIDRPGKDDQEILAHAIQLSESQLASLNLETAELFHTLHLPVERIQATLPEAAILDTAMGIDPHILDIFQGKILFEISSSVDGQTWTPRLREVHDLSSTEKIVDRWYPVSLDLHMHAGETIELRFAKSFMETSTSRARSVFDLSPTDFMFWRAPQIRSATPEAKKNLILLSIDTLRADHLHFMGYPRETSPTFDRLAREGVSFTRCTSQAPWTTPSHFSIITGTHPTTHGADKPIQDAGRWRNDEIPTLASVLRNRGYVTGAFTGKGPISAEFGFDKGFDFYNETPLNGEGSDIEGVIGKANAWLEKNVDRRFFLFIHTYEPHKPYTDSYFVKDDQDDLQEKIARYDGDIRRADHHVGELIEKLRNLSLIDETLIIMTSDHGEELSEGERRGFKHKDNPGHGHSLYEEALHVPLIFHGFDARGKINGQVRSIDIFPTALDYLGFAIPPTVEGESLRSRITGTLAPSLPALSEATMVGTERRSVRTERFKYIRRFSYGQLARPISLGHPLTPIEELYDLREDPGETVNLADSLPEVVRRLRDLMYRTLMLDIERGNLDPAEGRRLGMEQSTELRETLKSLGYID